MRKITNNSSVNILGVELPINAGKDKGGCYVEILETLHREMTNFLTHHNKMLFVRVDIRMHEYSESNQLMSTILRKIKRWLKQHYQMTHIGHLWAREHEKSKKQHYHLVLLVDGNKMRTPQKLIQWIEYQCETRDLPKPYTPMNCYTLIQRGNNENYAKAFYRGSYLAKQRGKNYKGKTANNFSASRIKI